RSAIVGQAAGRRCVPARTGQERRRRPRRACPGNLRTSAQTACTAIGPAGIAMGHCARPGVQLRRPRVKELVRYLLDNLYLDFQGEISVEKVREFLREDDTREARRLLAKIIEEKGVDDLLITLADCLKDHIR